MLNKEQIERNKDKLNIAPNVEFVARHLGRYQEGMLGLLSRPVSEQAKKLADSITFGSSDLIMQPQVNPDEVRRIVSAMPDSLIGLSKLVNVDYVGAIPVPIYDENGNFTKDVDWVDCADFPRKNDHPSRVLVGNSNGTKIWLTPLPKSVSTNDEAVKMYQAHVLLHEFFHTIDYPRRENGKRSAVLLECDGKSFTLQDFWDDFERLYIDKDRKPVSRYAATYSDKLNVETRTNDTKVYTSALGEQICESFVGHMLGIISNDNGIADFRRGHPEENGLIDRVCRAKVLKDE